MKHLPPYLKLAMTAFDGLENPMSIAAQAGVLCELRTVPVADAIIAALCAWGRESRANDEEYIIFVAALATNTADRVRAAAEPFTGANNEKPARTH